MSSRRRMIAAVACLSCEYFSIIELIAFSYAISGCFFSTSLIHSPTKPRHRFASLPKNPTFAMRGILDQLVLREIRGVEQTERPVHRPGRQTCDGSAISRRADREVLGPRR